MTIVAGFKCEQGIVICGDTQESVGGLSKRNVPKLRFEPNGLTPTAKELAVCFAGATENGPFLDRLVTDCWKASQAAQELDEACNLVKDAVEGHYRNYGAIYQPGYCPTAELVFGIKMGGASRLFHAMDAVVNEVIEDKSYVAAGIGQYLADFLIPRSFSRRLNIYQCIAIAAYVLFQAKTHVEGCGGASDIAFLRNEGTSGVAEEAIVDTVTHLASIVDSRFGWLLPAYSDPSTDQDKFERLAKDYIRTLTIQRREDLKKLSEWNEFWGKSLKDLGLDS